MGTYKEVEGNLIDMALNGEFDVISHGVNCFCTMGSGIAPHMAKNFFANRYRMELSNKGDYNKLGQIDFQTFEISYDKEVFSPLFNGAYKSESFQTKGDLTVVNSYTQYHYGSHPDKKSNVLLEYDALSMCLKKINHKFKGKSIGLPLIGCGLAGGDWTIVKQMIQEVLVDMDVTIVKLPQ